ncbi:methyltransferase, TIGR04325 family [Sphingobacterium yanglingense]|uniref:Putative methyltransferase (TIGR04325 family) n=1 Tax=Sphingobacterium yanglingense TaxID=1437280 RepID=A0A4R6WEN4_9SPHI|nr:methyltransferase, TIGR04325 family [Sphingobacterium yanglingense]TDQ76642.1 putative methyltransferase (TIGR04325 family) [Sphingobacterium yanglingense]
MRFFSKKKAVVAPPSYGWFGNYDSWESACLETTGYDQDNILRKTWAALAQIRDGDAVYERDSVLFDKKQYPFPLISCLLYIAAKNNNKLSVLDFGGSLGTTYFKVAEFMNPLDLLTWHIVEQSRHVEIGKKEFENEQLSFFYTIDDSMAKVRPHVILLSSVVQYLRDPHEFLTFLSSLNVDYILFDRTAFIKSGPDRLTVQKVPPSIYEASYPSWFFNEQAFLGHFSDYYVMADFMSYVEGESELQIDGELAGYDKGFLLCRKYEK